MGKGILILFIILLTISVIVPSINAASANYLIDSSTTQIAITDLVNSAYNTSTRGGNTTIVSLSGSTQTLHWAGFIGNVTLQQGLFATISTITYSMFRTVVNVTSLDAIAATSDAEFSWNTLQTVTAANANVCLNVSATSGDSVTNLYVNTTQTYSAISSFITLFANNNASRAEANWPTSIGADAASPCPNSGIDNLVFLANYNATVGSTWYNNVTANYQLLVGINETDDLADTAQDIRFSFFVVNP